MRGLPSWLGILLCVVLAGVVQAEEDPNALNARAVELYRKGDYAGATKVAEQAVKVAERQFGKDAVDTATLINNLAGFYNLQDKYAEAEPLFTRSLAIYEKALGPDHPHTATSLNNLAQLYEARGKYAEAELLYKRALAIWKKALGPDHPDTAQGFDNLAKIYNSQGKYAEAEPLFKRALAIREKAVGSDHRDTATTLNGLAFVCQSQGKYAEAEPLYKRALAIKEKALGPNHSETATSLNNLAQLYDVQGKYAEAEPLYKRALAIKEKSLGPDHRDTAITLNNLACLYDAQGKYAEAEPLYMRALAIYEKTFGPDHPLTAASLTNLASLDAAIGRWSDAAHLRDRARRGTRRHVARVLPSLSATEQVVFLRTQDEAGFHAALTLGLLQKATPQIASLSAGWLANGKAVAQEAAAQQIILARKSENPATAQSVAALEKVRADIAKLSQQTPAPDKAAGWRAAIEKLQADELRLVHEIGGQLAAIDRDEPWVEIDVLRKTIPADAVVVDIARFGIIDFKATGTALRWKAARYAAWIVPPSGKGNVTILDLGPADEIDAAVAAYRAAIDAVQKGGFKRGQDTAEQELKITAAPLTQKVLQPIVEAIGPATEIILSPDGSLWLVPWQGLPLADGTYAIEKFAIRTVTSARDLVPAPVPVDAKGGRGGSVVVADPAFEVAPAEPAGKRATDASRSFAPATGIERRFNRLPNTRTEALASKPVLTSLTGSEPKVLFGADASETNLKQAAVRPKTVVLATHGFFKPDQEVKRDDKAATSLASAAPGSRGATRAVTTTGEALEDPLLRCGLALAGANVGAKTTGGDDGILTGAEIVGLDLLGTDLVVLSACETGVGTVKNGEGVAGLRQAFQIAGATSVVATLWQVPDAESAQIMQSFYANLATGQPPSQALREAQLAFIKARREDRNYEAAHPYLWAAYGVTGR